MSLSRLGDYLDQMLTAANDARRFVDGMSKEDFLADKHTQQAVVMSSSLSARPPPGLWTSISNSSLTIPRYLGAA
jgi:hypothetical protein